MKRYLIVLEGTGTGYSAYSPDLLGCIATGATEVEVKRKMREAIEFHVAGLREQGDSVPEPRSSSSYVEVRA
jgi:predicted RNase H-like HicB family nuclease